MAAYNNFRRGNWGYNPYKKYKTSGGSRRSNGNFKAAKQTKDAMNFVIKCNYAFTANYSRETIDENTVNEYGTAVINIYDVLRNNSQFAGFANIYDQIKVNGIKSKINVVDADTSIANIQSVKTINIVTAWDRTGISSDQVEFYKVTVDPEHPEVDPVDTKILQQDWDSQSASKFKYLIGSGIVNGTGANKSILNSFQRWSSSPFLYASTIQEKGCYISTDNFHEFIDHLDTDDSFNYISDSYKDGKINENFNSVNPCVPFESASLPWKPTLMVGVFKSGIDNVNKKVSQYLPCENVVFNAEFTIDCTFRNMKAAM